MIIVTGATGQLGRAIVEQLLERVPASEIGVSVRNPDQAADLTQRGVRVRHGDFNDAASLTRAFEGGTQVLLVSSNSGGSETVRQHQTAIEAAREAGARRILYTSHMGAGPASAFPPMRTHAATEDLLRRSGVAFTSLRNGFYADSGVAFMGNAVQTGELAVPQDGPVSWTTHADLAEVTALLLADEGRLDGLTPPLTGAEALDLAGLAALAAEITGRPIRREVMGDNEFRAQMVSGGTPGPRIEVSMGFYVASRQREFAAVDPTLGALLGRAPRTMREVLTGRLSE